MKLQLARAQALLNQTKPNPDEAMKVLQPLVNRKNAPWPVFHYSGIAFLQKKEYDTALSFFLESVRQGADAAETHHSISICYFNLGSYDEAEEHANIALEKKPEFFKGWLHLGSLYRAQAKLDEALKCYQKANALDPKSAGVAYRIGEIYNDQGDLNKAHELYSIATKIDEEYTTAWLAMAQVERHRKNYDDAEECIYKVLNQNPKNLAARVELAEHFKHIGNYEKAIELYEKLVPEFPNTVGVRVNYALCLQELGRFDESEKHYMIAFEKQPESFESLSNYLMGVHYNPERTKDEIFEAHKLWDKHFAPKEKPERPVPFDTSKEKKLRVGFISGGFRTHPVGWMITKALENLPKDQFETYCYTTNNKYDKITQRIHTATDKWQSVIGYGDAVIARMIREDELDILVELSGHSADTRLKTVAMQPAPIIIKWVGGLFNTTGLESVDYLITDKYETPEGEEEYYTEKLIRMPDDYVTYMPPEYTPDVEELPVKENGHITFGCFNNPTKVNDEILVKWAGIMNKVPESRLFLKSKQYDTEALRDRIIETMKGCGIDEDRLRFEGLSPHEELLRKYNEVDIALDPWPYSGGLTTCEALWMGIPVVTKPGPTFAGRHSTTHLINAGLPELVVNSWKEYEEKVVELATDIEFLANLRSGLRAKVDNSPIVDGRRYGAHLSQAFRATWHQWVDGFENNNENWADHIDVEPIDEEQVQQSAKIEEQNLKNDDAVMIDFIEKEKNGVAKVTSNSGNGVSTNGFVNGHHNNGTSAKSEEKPESFKIETRDGVKICTPPDAELLTAYVLLEQRQWYENELDFVRDYVKPGMTFLDIGAGFGVYSLPAAKLVGDNGHVFAFEPGTLAKRHLEMSKLENGLGQLEVIGKAINDKNGNQSWMTGKTPEFSRLDDSGEESVSSVTLDVWWQFEVEPEIDVIKVDVNGNEANVLSGATDLLEKESPVILLSITEAEPDAFADILANLGYSLFEYIPGPGLLTAHDREAGSDPYMQNLVAVKCDRLESLRDSGWLYNESVASPDVDNDLWKTELSKFPWTASLMETWENQKRSEGIDSYLQALNYLIRAEQIDLRNTELREARSQKAVLMLEAAQILINLYNQGANSTSVVFTLVRTLNALGKRSQAVEVMQKLVETTKLGQENMNVDLPFMLPVPEQDNAPIKTDLNKWLMVKTIEAWILLKDVSTWFSGAQEKKLLEVLEGNPEVIAAIKRALAPEKGVNKNVQLPIVSAKSEGTPVKSPDKLNKVILILAGKKGGAHGIHMKFANILADSMQRQGIETEAVHATSGDFIKKVVQASNEPGTGIYTGPMGYDLRVQADMNLQGNMFDILDKKAVGYLGDHPYTQFMWNRMYNVGRKVTFITPCHSIKDEFHSILGTKNEVLQIDKLPAITNNNKLEKVPATEKRAIDLLIPLGLHKHLISQKTITQELAKFGEQAKRVGQKTFERMSDNYFESIFEAFLKELQAEKGNEFSFEGVHRKEDQLWLSVLSTVDWYIRKERRINILSGLEQVGESKHIVITASPEVQKLLPNLKGKNIKWIGEVNNDQLDKLYLESKQVLNSNPTYPDGVHGRIRSAMISGAGVISDSSSVLENIFGSKDGISFVGYNGENLIDHLERPNSKIQHTADTGREIIQQSFSIDNYTKRLLTVIDKNR